MGFNNFILISALIFRVVFLGTIDKSIIMSFLIYKCFPIVEFQPNRIYKRFDQKYLTKNFQQKNSGKMFW